MTSTHTYTVRVGAFLNKQLSTHLLEFSSIRQWKMEMCVVSRFLISSHQALDNVFLAFYEKKFLTASDKQVCAHGEANAKQEVHSVRRGQAVRTDAHERG